MTLTWENHYENNLIIVGCMKTRQVICGLLLAAAAWINLTLKAAPSPITRMTLTIGP